MKRVVVLIDGQNLFYALQSLQLKEREIDWTRFLASLLEPNDELMRTYWFRPQKLQDGHFTEDNIRNQIIYKQFSGCYESYRQKRLDKIDPATWAKIEAECESVLHWIHEQRGIFSSIEYNYDQLCLENADIEIVKTGILKINPYKRLLIGEKGVDIA